MCQLRHEIEDMGGTVVHIKTDSIKVSNPTEEIKNYILNRGKEFGYTFEIESIYTKFCLVNNAVYVARCSMDKENGDKAGHWTATEPNSKSHMYLRNALHMKKSNSMFSVKQKK